MIQRLKLAPDFHLRLDEHESRGEHQVQCEVIVVQRLLVHFDVQENYVLLDTFVSSALAAKQAAEAINAHLFEGKLRIELVIYAPEPGSLKQYIRVSVQGLGSIGVFMLGLTQFLDSPSVQQITKEVFGNHATEAIIQEIRELKDRENEVEGVFDLEAPHSLEEAALLSERVITQTVGASLQVSRDTLARPDFPGRLAYEIGEAQAKLFSAALSDPWVNGIGFSEEEDFPIPRNQFAARAVRPFPPRDDDEVDTWEVTVQQIRLDSPVFEKNRPFRKWAGKSLNGAIIFFDMVDEAFWNRLKRREFQFGDGTSLLVQMATRTSGRGPKERKVVRVLRVNDQTVAEQLSDDALGAIIGNFTKLEQERGQKSLF